MSKKGNRAVLTLLSGVVGSCAITSGASFDYIHMMDYIYQALIIINSITIY